MATMEDIAKKLCISKGTVSKALSGAPDVSETMRKTILETAVELGYQRGLRRDEAMRLAVAHLQGLGHRRIGYLSGFLGSFINQQRYDAFFQALRAHGLPHEESLGGSSSYTAACLETCLPALLAQGVTAIVCSHDLLAHALMVHARERGLRVPEDLSVVGFDDLPLSAHTAPPMTTLRQDRLEIGRSAYHALKSLQGGIPISTILLHARLVERQSTAPPGLRP